MRCALHDDLARSPIDSRNGQFDCATAREVESVQAIATESHQPSSLDPISFADSNSKIRLEKPSYASPELRPQQGYAHREKLSMVYTRHARDPYLESTAGALTTVK